MIRGLLLAATLMLGLAGCGRTELGDEPDAKRYFAFVADARQLEHFELHVVDALDPDREIHRVSNTTDSVGIWEVTWSPDGRWLSFDGGGLFVADSENAFAVRQLSNVPAGAIWSTTSRWLAFFVDEPARALIVKDVLGLLSDIVEPMFQPSHHGIAIWSPTRDAVLFAREVDAGRSKEWFIAAPGEPTRALGVESTGLPARDLRWSPDGTRIAMQLVDAGVRELLYVVDVDQNPMSPRLLLDPGAVDGVYEYAWSGDSSLLVAQTHYSGMWSISADGAPDPESLGDGMYGWQVCNQGRTLAYLAEEEGFPPDALYVRTLGGGEVSDATLIDARAIDNLETSTKSDVLLFELWDWPGRLYYASASGGPGKALHEAEKLRPYQAFAPISPDGRRVLLQLKGDAPELRAVDLSDAPATGLAIAATGGDLGDARWGTSSVFSFVHALDGWDSIYFGSLRDETVTPVYAPHSNLRSFQWTGWQP